MASETKIGEREAIAFLNEAARYFENRPTGGEDRAYWANVYNAEKCRRIAALLTALSAPEKAGEVET